MLEETPTQTSPPSLNYVHSFRRAPQQARQFIVVDFFLLSWSVREISAAVDVSRFRKYLIPVTNTHSNSRLWNAGESPLKMPPTYEPAKKKRLLGISCLEFWRMSTWGYELFVKSIATLQF